MPKKKVPGWIYPEELFLVTSGTHQAADLFCGKQTRGSDGRVSLTLEWKHEMARMGHKAKLVQVVQG